VLTTSPFVIDMWGARGVGPACHPEGIHAGEAFCSGHGNGPSADHYLPLVVRDDAKGTMKLHLGVQIQLYFGGRQIQLLW
jgi:hypothetical protein